MINSYSSKLSSLWYLNSFTTLQKTSTLTGSYSGHVCFVLLLQALCSTLWCSITFCTSNLISCSTVLPHSFLSMEKTFRCLLRFLKLQREGQTKKKYVNGISRFCQLGNSRSRSSCMCGRLCQDIIQRGFQVLHWNLNSVYWDWKKHECKLSVCSHAFLHIETILKPKI